MNTYYVELNFSGSNTIDTGIAVSQGDYGKVQLSIACKKDGQFISDAESAEIIFQTEKGKVINGDLTGSGGLYGYVFQGNELQDPGKLVATVTLHYEDGQTSSESFLMAVRYNPLYDQNLQAGPYITQLEKLQAQAQGYVDYIGAIIEQLRQDIGETALTKADLQNDFLQSAPGLKALDAALGPQILQKFTQLYSDKAGVDHNHNGVYLATWSSRINSVSFNGTMNAPVMYIDSTEYPIIKGPQGGNYTVRTLSITTNPDTKKRSMLVEWYADGHIYRNYCDLTVS